MQVKKYLARTLADAVAQVRAELGPDAIILQTQKVKVGGIFGLFAQRMVEVTAAWDPGLRPRPAAPPAAETRPGTGRAPGASPESPGAGPAARGDGGQPAAPGETGTRAWRLAAPDGELADLVARMERMDGLLTQVLERLEAPPRSGLLPEVQPVYTGLVQSGVEPDLATSICRRVQSRWRRSPETPVLDLAEEVLTQCLGVPETIRVAPGERRVVALMGPTGVGKTTTLAKLAAFWALRRGVKVALLTADTYRIAAVEQLRTYCEIMGLPLEVVERPEEVPRALDRHRDADLILVDTAGRSHRNREQMEELAAYLDALRPDERYLVLSLTASTRDARAVVDSYRPIGFHKLLFTKLDEATAPGVLLNTLVHAGRPLSYITTGQNVPDDIEVASPERLSRILLGDRS
ncbi:MAG: flagellar biosynthesis protein FlhF [Bacillota bacterium]